MSRSLKAHILLVFATLVWGSTFVLIKAALAGITPLAFNAVRMLMAALLLGLIYHRQLRSLTRNAVLAGAAVGFFLFVGYEFQTTGLKYTEATKSAFLTGMSVVLVPILLKIGWKKHINRWTLLGILISFAGLYFLTIPGGAAGLSLFHGINRGDVLTIIAAVAFAFQIVAVGRAAARHRFELVVFTQIASAALFMAITTPILERPHVSWTPAVIWALVITGLFGTVAAFAIQAWAQQFTPPTHTALIFMMEPVFAWVTAAIMGERLGLRSAIGAVMILGGVALSEVLGSAVHPSEELDRGSASP